MSAVARTTADRGSPRIRGDAGEVIEIAHVLDERDLADERRDAQVLDTRRRRAGDADRAVGDDVGSGGLGTLEGGPGRDQRRQQGHGGDRLEPREEAPLEPFGAPAPDQQGAAQAPETEGHHDEDEDRVEDRGARKKSVG